MTIEALSNQYEKRRKRQIVIIVLMILLLFISLLMSVVIGTADISLRELIKYSIAYFSDLDSIGSEEIRSLKIIFLLRVPRVILGIFAGIGLSVSGTVMQSITRNPLVSPFTVGISSAAAFGASIAIVLGIGIKPDTPMGIVLNAFLMSLMCAFIVYGIASRIGMSAEALILTGVGLSYLFSALTATLQFVADENQLSQAIQWTFGSFNGANWTQVIIVGAFVTFGFIILYRYSWVLNGMSSSSDEFVKGVGINPKKVRSRLGIVTVVITSVIISFTGVIGFIGLVSPHISRMIIGNDHRYLLPLSGLVGGVLLLLSDTVGRSIISPIIIPVGIIVSYVGVPLFIHLISKGRKEGF